MADRRTLLVHAGGGKAGSSAIQSALGQTADALAEVGISYAHAPAASSPYAITSGNGFPLYERIGRPDWDSRGQALIESYLGENQIGICSSEFLGSMPKSYWRRLVETADACGIDVKVVFFVRSAVGYVVASYNQDVKRAGEHRTLDEAACDAGWQHLDDLRKLDELFDERDLRVINFDIARRDIIGALINACPELVPAEDPLRSVGEITVNRSLTGAEIEVLRCTNARLGQKFSQEISDRLIYDEPELHGTPEPSEETLQILAGKFEDATSWINSRFFPDPQSALQFRPEVPPTKRSGADRNERPLRIALDWALEKIAAGSGDQLATLREALLGIDWHNSNDPQIPHDFDPIAYLLINVDVLRSKNSPYLHYIESGHSEDREYRWPLRLDASGDATISDAIARLRLENSKEWPDTALWPRLRHSLQLEGLLHGFANRERDYLDEIRRLHEEHGFDNERFRQRLGETVRPVQAAVEAVRADAIEQSERRSRAFETSMSKLSETMAAEISALRDTQSGALQSSLSLRDAQVEGVRSSLMKLTETLTAEISALRNEQATLNATFRQKDAELSALNATLRQKDAELTTQARLLDCYRDTGFFKFLKWALQRSKRP